MRDFALSLAVGAVLTLALMLGGCATPGHERHAEDDPMAEYGPLNCCVVPFGQLLRIGE